MRRNDYEILAKALRMAELDVLDTDWDVILSDDEIDQQEALLLRGVDIARESIAVMLSENNRAFDVERFNKDSHTVVYLLTGRGFYA